MNQLLRFAVVLALAIGGAMSPAYAGPGWDFTVPPSSDNVYNTNDQGQYDFATQFTVSSGVTVTGLGFFSDGTTVNDNPVALYQCADTACDSTATLLASATVTDANPQYGNFRYVTISPVTLTTGVTYEVAGATAGTDEDYTCCNSGFAADPTITIANDGSGDTDLYSSSTTPDFLNNADFGTDIPGENGWWGPDVFLSDTSFVPEPASLALLGAGVSALGLIRRRRSRRG